MESNFDFLKLDNCTSGLFATLNMAEQNFLIKDYQGVMTKCRSVAEEITKMVIDREGGRIPERISFNDLLKAAKLCIRDKSVIDALYDIKSKGNAATHELNSDLATADNTLSVMERIYDVLVWFVHNYLNRNIKTSALQFSEPQAQERYKAAERKFIYIQSVPNKDGLWPAYEGAEKIGEGTTPDDDLEADWRPNSEFLRNLAPKRINQYMKTAGVPFHLDWVELAFNKKTKEWFHDYDVHNVLNRSGIEHAKHLDGNEWFDVDLETAKEAIKAVKEGRSSLEAQAANAHADEIILRPEQAEAVKKTKEVFKKKNEMLWNAKMRFGKTLTTLQLIKEMQYKRVLIMTHRPVVADSWFEDFAKMKMSAAGYQYGSVDKGELLKNLKTADKPFIYFASIQYLRYGGGASNLPEFADVNWDLIVVDEAHEGTQTELSDAVFDALVKKDTRILSLSGTPFNLLDHYDENQVYTWDYTMEQSAKLRWSLEHPGEPNPYEKLPKVNMYTFEMKQADKFSDESKSFNFREFFRTDDEGNLVYKKDVVAFLDNITNYDSRSKYPFSTKEYREELRHTLWLMPGIKEANAFEKCLREHPVFGQEYTIVNVVIDLSSDDGQATEGDLDKVRQAIGDDPSQTKTITLTVRRLTTGVNIPEWTAVMFLSNTNSAMNYLQAAFRAQTPFSHEKLGMKKNCYIFDFAPDRALTIMAESAQINTDVGKKNTQQQKDAFVQLLNFLPVLGQTDTGMKAYNVDRMLTQLKKVYAEKAVRAGFEDDSLYSDALLTITNEEASAFNDLRGIVGKTNKNRTSVVTVNTNGLTDEEYEESEKAKKKPKRERTPEEQDAIEKFNEAKKQRRNLISILRSVSIRIPMMIYGMPIDLDQDISLNKFIELVDDKSWTEFMPEGFTKEMFKKFAKYYDSNVFIEAGHIIRRRAKSYDKLDYIERAEKIAELFATFKNPDKETVLTPWRVINMQFGKTLGGLNFYDDSYQHMTLDGVSTTHWVDKEETKELFKDGINFLDINSKSGLYPLYVAISLYYKKIQEDNRFNPDEIYGNILKNQVFAIAKTPMAKTITERTLAGYKNFKTNVKYISDFSGIIQKNINFGKKKVEEEFNDMKFDVVIGNPPYQESTNSGEVRLGQEKSVKNVFQHFQLIADDLATKYSCLIYPGVRWIHRSGKGLGNFGKEQINSSTLSKLYFYPDAEEIFTDVAIADGISIVLKDYNKKNHSFEYTYVHNNEEETINLESPGDELLTLDPNNYFIVEKLKEFMNTYKLPSISNSDVKSRSLFSIESDFAEKNADKIRVYNVGDKFDINTEVKLLTNDKSGKMGRATWFITNRDVITTNQSLINKWKVIVSSANAGGQKRDNQLEVIDNYSVFGRSRIALKMFDTEEEALNCKKYLQSYIARFAFLMTAESLTSLAKVVPDLVDYTPNNKLIDFSSDIDTQLVSLLNLSEEQFESIKFQVDNIRNKSCP